MSPIIHYYTSLPSTNKKAHAIAQQGGGHGEIVQARTQTAGRGRLGKSWQSPSGKGLYFSIILRPEKLAYHDYSKITMTAGLAVAKVVEDKTATSAYLKWPNDLYLAGKKCCGILAESRPAINQRPAFAILGVGLNVNTSLHEFPPELRENATSLFIETGKLSDMDELLAALHQEILSMINRLENQGFTGILDEWRQRDFLVGKWLEWVTNSGEVVYGVSVGPGSGGELRVRDLNGVIHDVISGDINLATKK